MVIAFRDHHFKPMRVMVSEVICLRKNWPALELPASFRRFVDEAEIRSDFVDEPMFVASDYQLAYAALTTLPVGRICEWGCGLGVVAGMASLLGWEAVGIEQNEELAGMARQLHADFGLWTEIVDGDLFYTKEPAELYYAFMWPDLVEPMQEYFALHAPPGARLILHDATGRMELFMRKAEADTVCEEVSEL